jgi:hypothetical protein
MIPPPLKGAPRRLFHDGFAEKIDISSLEDHPK